jgi:2-polyprenyl-6-methoxyphenol hydroxylase-like FAD-dependent oxidoreductase
LGYAEELVSKGIKGEGTVIFNRTTPLLRTSFTHYLQGATEFPFTLFIPQHDIESFLEAKVNALGVDVHRGARLTGMEEGGAGGIKLIFENGESVHATYVVAADGSRSKVRANLRTLSSMLTLLQVRELAGVSFHSPFPGSPYYIPPQGDIEKNAHYVTLADILLEGTYPSTFLRNHGTFTVHPSGVFFLVPLPFPDDIGPSNLKNLTFWRTGFNLTITPEVPPTQPDLAYIQECFNKRRDMWEEKEWPKVAEVRAASSFRVREAIASTAYKPFGDGGHILLAGDAAHTHSPSGGQGMFK